VTHTIDKQRRASAGKFDWLANLPPYLSFLA
jgi:hypothetical protein